MNILFLSTRSPYPLISGHSLRTYHILKGAAENHNVTLVTFIQLEDELRNDCLDHLRSFCRNVFTFRVPVDMSRIKLAASLLFNFLSPLPFVARKYDAPLMRQKIREIIKMEKIDLVHVDMLPLTVYINEFKDLPKILVNHNVESLRLFRWFRTESNLLKKAYLYTQWFKLRSFERSAMNRFDCCVAVSEVDKQLLRKMGINIRLVVVPNGTDTDFFRPSSEKPIENSLVWIGHMDVHTNRDAVLYFWGDIYPLLRRQYSKVRVTFVGTAPPKEITNASNRDSQIKVTGFVDDIRPYVQEAAVMVVPIRIGSGTRLKILDAMAMGKAIVATSVGCEGLNVTHGKNILVADTPQDFANATIELLTNNEIRNKLGQNARELAETYDWKIIRKNKK